MLQDFYVLTSRNFKCSIFFSTWSWKKCSQNSVAIYLFYFFTSKSEVSKIKFQGGFFVYVLYVKVLTIFFFLLNFLLNFFSVFFFFFSFKKQQTVLTVIAFAIFSELNEMRKDFAFVLFIYFKFIKNLMFDVYSFNTFL